MNVVNIERNLSKTKFTKVELEKLLAEVREELVEVREELDESQRQLEDLSTTNEELVCARAEVQHLKEVYDTITKELGLVEQVRVAFAGENRLALMFGAVFGGFIPVASFYVVHNEVNWEMHGIAMLVIALGALAFSAKTVWQWGNEAFKKDAWKAGGFVLLLEGVMTLSQLLWLGYTALGILTFINAVATGVTVSKTITKLQK